MPITRSGSSRATSKQTKNLKRKEPIVEEEDYDTTRFLSKPAQDSFYEDLEKKFLAERYITYDRAAYPFLYDQIEARGWNALLQRPVRDTFPGEIAREFYANAHFAKATEVAWVRGVDVSFTPEAINEFYHIAWPVGQRDETDNLFRRGEIEKHHIARMKAFLSIDNTITFEPLRHGQMKQEAKAWAVVMCSHLAPTSYNTTYGDDRVPLLYALTKGLKFNLGKVIHARLRSTIDRTATNQKSFIFPYLIFGLCKNAGVNFGVMQEVCRLGKTIGNASICATLGLTYQNYAPRPNPPAGNFHRAPREQQGLAALERKFMVHHEYTSNCINALNDKFDMALRAVLGDARFEAVPWPTLPPHPNFQEGQEVDEQDELTGPINTLAICKTLKLDFRSAYTDKTYSFSQADQEGQQDQEGQPDQPGQGGQEEEQVEGQPGSQEQRGIREEIHGLTHLVQTMSDRQDMLARYIHAMSDRQDAMFRMLHFDDEEERVLNARNH